MKTISTDSIPPHVWHADQTTCPRGMSVSLASPPLHDGPSPPPSPVGTTDPVLSCAEARVLMELLGAWSHAAAGWGNDPAMARRAWLVRGPAHYGTVHLTPVPVERVDEKHWRFPRRMPPSCAEHFPTPVTAATVRRIMSACDCHQPGYPIQVLYTRDVDGRHYIVAQHPRGTVQLREWVNDLHLVGTAALAQLRGTAPPDVPTRALGIAAGLKVLATRAREIDQLDQDWRTS